MKERREQLGSTGDITPPTFAQKLRELNYKFGKWVVNRSDRFWGGLIIAGAIIGGVGPLIFRSTLPITIGAGLILCGGIGIMGNHGNFDKSR